MIQDSRLQPARMVRLGFSGWMTPPVRVSSKKFVDYIFLNSSYASDCYNFLDNSSYTSDSHHFLDRLEIILWPRFLRLNLPAGAHPTAIAFSEGSSSVVVAAQMLSGSSLFMYGDVGPKPSAEGKQQAKLPLPEIKWEHQKIHDQGSVLNLSAVPATYGTADGSIIIASCSEGM